MRRSSVLPEEVGMWRYASSLPISFPDSRVSLHEGWTPLVPGEWNGLSVFWKLDYLCPTGSYKDRGMACLANRLHELGVREVIEDSSGNAGASMAAYCSLAGIRCRVYVPDYTSQGKCVQIRSYGAELVRIPGSREDTTRAAESAAQKTYYASHNWSPYFAHGIKTFGFEVWEQLGFRAPDAVLLPAGQGSLVLGWALAFEELMASGEINRLPRIYALQPEHCAPLESAFRKGMDAPDRVEKKETIAEGISSAEPVRGPQVLAAVRRSGGAILALSEKEIWNGFQALARRGLYVEPTSAVVAAALEKFVRKDVPENLTGTPVRKGERIVALLSGSGLKATDKVLSLYQAPPL
jgi:threonine synthase